MLLQDSHFAVNNTEKESKFSHDYSKLGKYIICPSRWYLAKLYFTLYKDPQKCPSLMINHLQVVFSSLSIVLQINYKIHLSSIYIINSQVPYYYQGFISLDTLDIIIVGVCCYSLTVYLKLINSNCSLLVYMRTPAIRRNHVYTDIQTKCNFPVLLSNNKY